MLSQGLSGKGGVTLSPDITGQALAIIGRGGCKAGRLYGSTSVRELGTKTIVADTLYLVPLLVPQRQAYNAICVYPTVAVSIGARMGIYRDTGGFSGDLVLDAGAITLTAAAQNNIAFSQTLDAGLYWAALVVNGGCTVNSTGASLHAYLQGVVNLNGTAPLFTVAHTYGALPSSFSNPTIAESTSQPYLAIKAA